MVEFSGSSDYAAMREAGEKLLEGKRQEHDAAHAEAEAALLEGKRQADLAEQLAAEISAIEKFIDHARELEQDFGGGPSQPPPKTAPPARRAAAAPPPTPAGGGRGAAKTRVSRSAFREQAREKIIAALHEIGDWAAGREIMEKAADLTKQTFLRAVRELIDAGKVEKRGATKTLRYRLTEKKTPVGDGPPPGRRKLSDPPPAPPAPKRAPAKRPPPKTPAPAQPPAEGGLRGRVLDGVDRHPYSTDAEIAQRLGRGTKAGKVEVTRILENLQDEGKLSYDVDGKDRRWRLPGKEPIKSGAAVQTTPSTGGSHQLHTDLEREIVHAVATAPKSIPQLADELDKERGSVGTVVNALVGRGVLRRGVRGTEAIFGKTPA